VGVPPIVPRPLYQMTPEKLRLLRVCSFLAGAVMAGVEEKEWVEFEIQRQLRDLSMEDVELEEDHEFSCHGDNQVR